MPPGPSTPSDRARRVVRHPLAALLVALVLVIGGGVVVTALLGRLGVPLPRDRPPQAIVPLVQVGWTLLAYHVFTRRIERRPDAEYAPRGAARELLAGLVGGVLLFSAVIGAIALFGGYRAAGRDPTFAIGPVLMVGLVPAFLEETIARGLIFRLLEAWLGSWPALALSAALFGAAHLLNPGATAFAALAVALEAGVLLGAAFMLTRRLWGAIGLHAGWNATQGGLWGVPVSGGAMRGLLLGRLAGPAWLTGGAFGAEASVPATVIAGGAGAVLLAVCARRGRIVPFLPRRRRG